MQEINLDTASLVRRANTLRLSSKILSDSIRSGNFRSMNKGRGIEFSGVREYLRGDDVRSIDWNVTARLGKTFVKQFEEDRELVLFVIVDASLSMQSSSVGKNRLVLACETAALSAFAASQLGSPVGGAIFDGDIVFSVEPKIGRDQVMLLLSKFDSTLEAACSDNRKKNTGSVLEKALRGAAQLLKKRSLILVISDFRTTGYEKSLTALGAKHDVVAIRIADALDTELPELGSIPFEDPESGFIQRLPTGSVSFRRAWRDAARNRVERWQSLCYKRGIMPVVFSSDCDPAQELQHFFSTRL
ncbi:MAG: DUF58 domain-containing protein [Spirochaetaceae bacterium]|nr:DUF58 domain-containing protein [Spirochaetaceae bacterium]